MSSAQNESFAFRFLDVPISSREQYLNKCSSIVKDEDVLMANANPALINEEMQSKLFLSTNFYQSAFYNHLGYSNYIENYDVPFFVSLNSMVYPTEKVFDVDGNYGGKFTPIEGYASLGFSKTVDRYRLGVDTKIGFADYYYSKNGGISFDGSIMYASEDEKTAICLLLKNIGYQFLGTSSSNSYTPFDIRLSFKKKLENSPFTFMLTASEIYKWDASTKLNQLNTQIWAYDQYIGTEDNFFTSIMSHLTIGTEVNLGNYFKLGFSYDCKKAEELTFSNYRGIPGLSIGFGIYSRLYTFGYSMGKLSAAGASHQLTFSLNLRDWIF